MLKRLCSLFLILALLFTLLPAQADIAPLTAQEIVTVRAFIAIEGEGSRLAARHGGNAADERPAGAAVSGMAFVR